MAFKENCDRATACASGHKIVRPDRESHAPVRLHALAEFTLRAFFRPLPGATPHRMGGGCPWSMPSLRAIT